VGVQQLRALLRRHVRGERQQRRPSRCKQLLLHGPGHRQGRQGRQQRDGGADVVLPLSCPAEGGCCFPCCCCCWPALGPAQKVLRRELHRCLQAAGPAARLAQGVQQRGARRQAEAEGGARLRPGREGAHEPLGGGVGGPAELCEGELLLLLLLQLLLGLVWPLLLQRLPTLPPLTAATSRLRLQERRQGLAEPHGGPGR
jgi:hypothetical protein